MLCKIVKQDESFFEHIKGKGQKMPLFGRGEKTWYKLIDHIKDDDYCFDRYSIMKSFIDDDNDRCYTDVPIQDKEANHILTGGTLTIDGDSIIADKRAKMYKDYQ